MVTGDAPHGARGVVLIGADAEAVRRMHARGYVIASAASGDAANVEFALAAVAAAMAGLRADPATSGIVTVAGYGAGGALAFLAATRLGADAAVTLWGRGIGAHLTDAKHLRVPLGMHFADDDPLVPFEEVRAVKAALEGFGTTEIYRYATRDAQAEEAAERRAWALLESAGTGRG